MFTEIGVAMLTVSILFPILATIAVALRFRARAIKDIRTGSDGWTIVLALLCAYVTNFLMSYAVCNSGYGIPQADLAGQLKEKFELVVFIVTIAWPTTLSIVKVSVILLYRRIFVISKFRLASNVLIAITLMWMISSVLVAVFAWTPISGQWTRIGTLKINYPAFLITTQVTSVILDIATLSLPLTVIRTLHMSSKRKMIISSIFLLGLLCLIGGITRLVYFVEYLKSVGLIGGEHEKAKSYSINTVPLLILWGLLEIDIAIIASCLPTYPPLLHDRAVESVIRSARSAISLRSLDSGTSRRKQGRQSHDKATQGWLELNGNANHSALVESNKKMKSDADSSETHEPVPGIRVNTEFSVAEA